VFSDLASEFWMKIVVNSGEWFQICCLRKLSFLLQWRNLSSCYTPNIHYHSEVDQIHCASCWERPRIVNIQLWLGTEQIIWLCVVRAGIQSVTESYGQNLGTSSTYQNKKIIYINTCPETFVLQLKNYCVDDNSSSALMCGQGFLMIVW
jgi:hypothetical protein